MTARRSRGRDLVRGLEEAARTAPEDRRTATFLRGLTIGALVGAAIAGSLLVGRRGRGGPHDSERQSGETP